MDDLQKLIIVTKFTAPTKPGIFDASRSQDNRPVQAPRTSGAAGTTRPDSAARAWPVLAGHARLTPASAAPLTQ